MHFAAVLRVSHIVGYGRSGILSATHRTGYTGFAGCLELTGVEYAFRDCVAAPLKRFQSGCSSGSAGLQARVSYALEFMAEAIFLSPLNAGLKARTTRTSGYTNPGTALANVDTNGSKVQLPSSALAERGGIRGRRGKTAERSKLS